MSERARELAETESSWLRRAKFDLLVRDPVDASNDAEALAKFARVRLDEMFRDALDGGPI